MESEGDHFEFLGDGGSTNEIGVIMRTICDRISIDDRAHIKIYHARSVVQIDHRRLFIISYYLSSLFIFILFNITK